MLTKEDWMEIKAQIEKGVYLQDIARELGVHPKTVSRAIKREGAPSGKRPLARGSKLDLFKPAIDELLREGVWNATVVLRELEARGYQGVRNPGKSMSRQCNFSVGSWFTEAYAAWTEAFAL
jgi:transposase